MPPTAAPLLQALHQEAQARLTPAGLLLTYGDVPGEYRAARESVALFDTTERGLVQVRGADAQEFLHRLLANRVRGLLPGQGNFNLLLNAKGKVLFGFDLWMTEAGFELATAPGQAAGLMRALDMYLFADKVQLADKSAESGALALVGPKAAELVRALTGGELPADQWVRSATWRGGPLTLRRGSQAGSPALIVDAGRAQAAELWRALLQLGARPAGRVAEDCLRVEAAQAQHGLDIDDNVYPQEARLESAFALDKGCYIGQEVVAKIDTYGGLNKRLVLVSIDHDDPLPRGTRLLGHDEERGERELGLVTSWAYSFELDRGLAIAYVKRRHQSPGTSFSLQAPSGEALPGRATLLRPPVRPDGLPVSGEFE
jgi:folate-binding protein YgfZ